MKQNDAIRISDKKFLDLVFGYCLLCCLSTDKSTYQYNVPIFMIHCYLEAHNNYYITRDESFKAQDRLLSFRSYLHLNWFSIISVTCLRTYPAIWTETVGWNLQSDLEFSFLAHFLGQIVRLPDQSLGLQYLLPQHLQAVLEVTLPTIEVWYIVSSSWPVLQTASNISI